eukprot:tig00000923_g5473.t1
MASRASPRPAQLARASPQPSPVDLLIGEDPSLAPYRADLQHRSDAYFRLLDRVSKEPGGLEAFSRSYEEFGLVRVTRGGRSGIQYREWAPGARGVFLFGEFNNWNRTAVPCQRDPYGHWTAWLPDHPDGRPQIPHGTKVKVSILTEMGYHVERIPAWIRYAVQQHGAVGYDGVAWWEAPAFFHPRPAPPASLRIYEAHVGIATEEHRLGYTAVQLMGIQEHAYYGSAGYHVTNFFAVSSRFGEAAGAPPSPRLRGRLEPAPPAPRPRAEAAPAPVLAQVLVDIVQAHASSNVRPPAPPPAPPPRLESPALPAKVNDGINLFDGTDSWLFHYGAAGRHPLWDSRMFDFGNYETVRFLLSNLRFFLDVYNVDGFRFDGVTAMLYKHRGAHVSFSGAYGEYFGPQTDLDACAYLALANHVVHAALPGAVTIAEDVSGMPGLARPVAAAGLGFDYRLAMGLPDLWFRNMRVRDEDWYMDGILAHLFGRRRLEKTVAYAESHDQAPPPRPAPPPPGPSPGAHRHRPRSLPPAARRRWEIYTHMSCSSPRTVTVDRALALHKMIRLITFGFGGEAYLTFMGNEFGHPDYAYARRQWHLIREHGLRFGYLLALEEDMIRLDDAFRFLPAPHRASTMHHEEHKVIACVQYNPRLFWPSTSTLRGRGWGRTRGQEGYQLGVPWRGVYHVVLDTDAPEMGGLGRRPRGAAYAASEAPAHGLPCSIRLDLPSRTAIVLFAEEPGPPPADLAAPEAPFVSPFAVPRGSPVSLPRTSPTGLPRSSPTRER